MDRKCGAREAETCAGGEKMDVAQKQCPTREWGQSVERAERAPKQGNTCYDVGSGARKGVVRRGGADVERAPLVEHLMRFCVRGFGVWSFYPRNTYVDYF